MQRKTLLVSVAFQALLLAGGVFAAGAARADGSQPFGPKFIVSCTIPDNGDLNPYGIAFVPKDFPLGGTIAPGDVLVANFNAKSNLQGTGVTIIQFTPSAGVVTPLVSVGQNGTATTFFTSNRKGLTTALGILRKGFVIVGNLPSASGGGSLQVINGNGKLVNTFTDPKFSGPWDLTINDEGATAQLFVSNVVDGTVVRLDLSVSDTNVAILSKNVIAQGGAFGIAVSASWFPFSFAAVDDVPNTVTVFSAPGVGSSSIPVAAGQYPIRTKSEGGGIWLRLRPPRSPQLIRESTGAIGLPP